MSVFARHVGGLRCLAWVPEVPGGFVTVSDRNGVIRMWNVSQTSPVELLKTGKDGFHSIYFVSNDVALCAFKDGMVSVYNTSRKQVRACFGHWLRHSALASCQPHNGPATHQERVPPRSHLVRMCSERVRPQSQGTPLAAPVVYLAHAPSAGASSYCSKACRSHDGAHGGVGTTHAAG